MKEFLRSIPFNKFMLAVTVCLSFFVASIPLVCTAQDNLGNASSTDANLAAHNTSLMLVQGYGSEIAQEMDFAIWHQLPAYMDSPSMLMLHISSLGDEVGNGLDKTARFVALREALSLALNPDFVKAHRNKIDQIYGAGSAKQLLDTAEAVHKMLEPLGPERHEEFGAMKSRLEAVHAKIMAEMQVSLDEIFERSMPKGLVTFDAPVSGSQKASAEIPLDVRAAMQLEPSKGGISAGSLPSGRTSPSVVSERELRTLQGQEQVQESWAKMRSYANDVITAYGLLGQLASYSSHSDDFFTNHSKEFPPSLSINTAGGRSFEFDPTMTEARIFPSGQFPKSEPMAVLKLGERPDVQIRAWLAATFLTRLVARIENNPRLEPFRVDRDGFRVTFFCQGHAAKYDAVREILYWDSTVVPVHNFSELAHAVAEGSGLRLPLPMNLTFDND